MNDSPMVKGNRKRHLDFRPGLCDLLPLRLVFEPIIGKLGLRLLVVAIHPRLIADLALRKRQKVFLTEFFTSGLLLDIQLFQHIFP